MYIKLIKYKDKFGKTEVPTHWDQDPELGIWVSNQRQKYMRGHMSDVRMKKLEDIGFKWKYW